MEEEKEESFNDILLELDKANNEVDHPLNAGYETRVKTPYDLVAEIAGLKHKLGNIFIEESTEKEYIRTKFGFQPSEVFNKGLQLTQLRIKHEDALRSLELLQVQRDNLSTDITVLKKDLEYFRDLFNNCSAKNLENEKKLEDYKGSLARAGKTNTFLIEDLTRLEEKNEELTIKCSVLTRQLNERKDPSEIIKYYTKLVNELTMSNEKLKQEVERLSSKQ